MILNVACTAKNLYNFFCFPKQISKFLNRVTLNAKWRYQVLLSEKFKTKITKHFLLLKKTEIKLKHKKTTTKKIQLVAKAIISNLFSLTWSTKINVLNWNKMNKNWIDIIKTIINKNYKSTHQNC